MQLKKKLSEELHWKLKQIMSGETSDPPVPPEGENIEREAERKNWEVTKKVAFSELQNKMVEVNKSPTFKNVLQLGWKAIFAFITSFLYLFTRFLQSGTWKRIKTLLAILLETIIVLAFLTAIYAVSSELEIFEMASEVAYWLKEYLQSAMP